LHSAENRECQSDEASDAGRNRNDRYVDGGGGDYVGGLRGLPDVVALVDHGGLLRPHEAD
jgi:hypoxanthine-guanine phosphoribosyltransferase